MSLRGVEEQAEITTGLWRSGLGGEHQQKAGHT